MHDHPAPSTQQPKVAIVYDQIAEFGGAERVLAGLMKAFPDAHIYTSFVSRKRLGMHADFMKGWRITQSFMRFVPYVARLYSPLRFLLPLVWRSFDLSGYDIVVCSSSWGMSKGVSLSRTRSSPQKSPRYLCYLHTPPRYLYGYDESPLRRYWIVRVYALIVNHFLRMYDYQSSQTIDTFIFNSEEVRRRSLKFYRRDGIIVHPPIRHALETTSGRTRVERTYYLTVSRLARTKHIDILIHACNKTRTPLKIVGVGLEYSNLKRIAGPTVELLGSMSDQDLDRLYAGARGFLYASKDEDFGMVPVEAMAYGVPVIAYASGGVKETVQDGERGLLYKSLTPEAVVEKIHMLEQMTEEEYVVTCDYARAFARSCHEEVFVRKLREVVSE